MPKVYLFSIFLILLAGVIYLNRTYAYFYDYLGATNLLAPEHPKVLVLTEGNGSAVIKYLAVGDSFTAGVGVDNYNESFPYILSRKLLEKNDRVTLVNLGRPGAKSEDLINIELKEGVANKPDIVTVMIGINDVHGLVSASKFRKNYEYIALELKKASAKVILINIPYLGGEKIVFFPYNYLLDFRTREFNKIIKEVAEKNNLKLVDLYSQTKDPFKGNPELYAKDFFHPSSEGYKLWGQLINAD